MSSAEASVGHALAGALAAERLRIIASLIRTTRDWDLAEDSLQDAAVRALRRWPSDGIPDNPAAWLTTTAQRCALDILRRRRRETEQVRQVQNMVDHLRDRQEPAGDDRLALIFSCCHPALPMAGRVALTLKTVSGLSTRQIAAAFLTSEATMSQRLLRAKNKIAHSGIGFSLPEAHRLAERSAGVLAVIYLLFNEGYTASVGPADDPLLAREAVELAGLVCELLPMDAEAEGLHALLMLQHSRRSTRVDANGDLIAMEDQDRRGWDARLIEGGLAALQRSRTAARGAAGAYRVQAEIAALHARAPVAAATDWAAVVSWYDALLVIWPSPVVALNRAVATGFRDGPEAGLVAVDAIADDPRLAGYHLVPAVRADLFRRAGQVAEAGAAYQSAIAKARTDAERRFLTRRLLELGR